jgi:Leucine-rich repeat (LRR) protein
MLQLTVLSLAANRLTSTVPSLNQLPLLNTLDLNANSLALLSENQFEGCSQLKLLYLANNRLIALGVLIGSMPTPSS